MMQLCFRLAVSDAVAETSAKIASARTKGTSGHRDPQLPLQRLRHFTTKILPESVESMRPSTGRPVNVARGSSSAWRSREDMEARASETTRRRRAQAQALDAPQKKSGQSSAQLAARPSSDRSVRLAEATKGLRSTSFTKHVEGFHVVQELQTTPAEAKTHGLGVLFAKMTKDTKVSVVLRRGNTYSSLNERDACNGIHDRSCYAQHFPVIAARLGISQSRVCCWKFAPFGPRLASNI